MESRAIHEEQDSKSPTTTEILGGMARRRRRKSQQETNPYPGWSYGERVRYAEFSCRGRGDVSFGQCLLLSLLTLVVVHGNEQFRERFVCLFVCSSQRIPCFWGQASFRLKLRRGRQCVYVMFALDAWSATHPSAVVCVPTALRWRWRNPSRSSIKVHGPFQPSILLLLFCCL